MPTPDRNARCFFTQQVFLIGTYDADGSAHFAPISWISWTFGPPACLVISMHGDKRTKTNFERTGMLSATVLTPDLLAFAESNNDATRNANAHPEIVIGKGSLLEVPLIADAKFSYECRLRESVAIGETHTYFAEIMKINVSEEIAALEHYDLCKIDPVIYSPGHYYAVGKPLGEIGDYS